MGILAAAVVLGAVYWYFVIRQPAPEVAQTTPTPSFSETPTPTPIDIFEAIFPNKAGSISLPASGDPSTTFQNALNLLNVDPGKFGVVSVVNTNPDGSVSNPLTALDLLDRFLISYPAELKPLVTTHSVILAYGQQEQFDAKGKLLANPTPSKRIVLVTEAKSSVLDVLKTWETNMTQVLAGLFGFDKTKNKGPFQDNNYQGVAIRFKNFPNPDHSIDYGVLDYNGKSYWIMASSREAMFAAIGAFIVPGK